MKNYIDADRLKELIKNHYRKQVKLAEETVNDRYYCVAHGLELADGIIDLMLKESNQ